MTKPFAHLHLHTQYSIVDSTVRIPELMKRCVDAGMPAVALTDQDNIFGLVKFYKQALRHGVKPLIGVDLRIRNDDDAASFASLVLLCQSEAGYRNLTRLVSRCYLEGQVRGVPMAERSWLDDASCGDLIALSGGLAGDVGRSLVNEHADIAEQQLEHWLTVFGDRYYLELTRAGRPDEAQCMQHTLELASRRSVPVVASNDVRFIDRQDFEAHEARVCINESRTLDDSSRPRRFSPEQYLRDGDEMTELFADAPEAISNALEIARRCNLNLQLGSSVLPAFPVPDAQTEEGYLREESARGLRRFLEKKHKREATTAEQQNAVAAPYQQRLDAELDVICEMGFPGYFLIVADFIRWAKEQGIPVGPGRGSGAGSLVAFVLGITAIDPLEFDLLFERFLNPERVSMPDFDVDFCMEGRDRVIDYVAARYGRERVSQIITYGTMAAKAVVRDAGRVLGHPYGFVDRIAKQIPFELGMTLDKALEQEAELAALYGDDDEVRSLIDLARSLEGLVRNAGKHAGGVVIAPGKLTDFTPLYCEEGGLNVVTQLDKDDVEAAGLVKFDFLGLKTLTIIDWAVRIINDAQPESPIDIEAIPMTDSKTFRLLQACKTTAVFQLESRGMRDLIKRLRPDQFEDLIALVALFRPGPLQSGMVDDFIARKHDLSKAAIDYLHPDLKPVLEPTYGVILYQEQVMQIAQVLAGYTLGGADLLRRAMGKKKPEEMAKQREIFVTGATERGVEVATATRIFDLMEKFAGYGFNKSHSAAYALLSYQTAYLKAHYTEAFMSAVMTADIDNTDRLVMLKDDCRQLGIELVPPDINRSSYAFSVAGSKHILYGLGAIKGVGKSAVDAMIAERERQGPFTGLVEFVGRIELDKVNRRALEALIKSGALDVFGESRRGLIEQLPEALQSAGQAARAAEAGQNDMFGLCNDEAPKDAVAPPAPLREWTEDELLRNEKEALGLYLTGHPFRAVARDAACFVDGALGAISSEPQPQSNGQRNYAQSQRTVTVAGLIMDIRKRGSRVTVTLDDDSGRLDISLFNESFQEYRHLLNKDEIIVVFGTLRYDEFIGGWQVNAKTVVPIDRIIEQRASTMILQVDPNGHGQQLLSQLHDVLLPHREGQCDVAVHYTGNAASARLKLGPEWSVRPSRELRDKLTELLGRDAVRLLYTPGHEMR
ncbi:MAG: DNA polymerase III subunit alpha [Woeseia sp.]|nr:DNA polymerase III subunit alpha [Woeseia sp.]NNE62038.1 DNA polymerase III subunit alpha [Woeseia sp.]NNL55054.1 DNA polymerase III subunit alpha [Woeseia sp.]